MHEINVRFWGVRGGYPAPGENTIRYGGNTPCVEVRTGGHTIILDAGTGIIPLGRSLAKESKAIRALVLFSHLHHDHTQGFPFFAPAYNPSAQLMLIGPGATDETLEELLIRNQTPPAFPITLREMSAAKTIRSIRETDVIQLDENGIRFERERSGSGVRIRSLKSYAHPGGVLIYRIECGDVSLVYATDTEGYVGVDRRLAAFAKDADLLIHDAQYSEAHYRGQRQGFAATQGFGHSTPQMACELALAANVKRLALFHHDPNYDDTMLDQLEDESQNHFAGALMAREGMEIKLAAHESSASVFADRSNISAYQVRATHP
jgi:phosphoribosyl 1,2-cyclic phosphodiesterase